MIETASANPGSPSKATDPALWDGAMVVPAHVATDDGLVEADFDAEDWFRSATDDEIKELIGCDFGGDRISDEVAEHFDGSNSGVSAVLAHSRHMADVLRNSRGDLSGYECHVDETAAKLWIAANRSDVYAAAFTPTTGVQR